MASVRKKFYSNPGFCQQSEYYNYKEHSTRPETKCFCLECRQIEGYNTLSQVQQEHKSLSQSIIENIYDNNEETYNEMLVDDTYSSPIKIFQHNYTDNSLNTNYCLSTNDIEDNQIKNRIGRYSVTQAEDICKEIRPLKHSHEYIPMQEQGTSIYNQRIIYDQLPINQEGTERVHRYAVILPEQDVQYLTEKENNDNRHKYISDDIDNQDYQLQEINKNRDDRIRHQEYYRVSHVNSSPTSHKANSDATQKLYELLSTPKKKQRMSATFQKTIPSRQSQCYHASSANDPFLTSNKLLSKLLPRTQTSKAQQKLNYNISTNNYVHENKRPNTTIITPICSSPVQSIYSETTFSNKTESWTNLSIQKPPVQATLAVAAIMMTLCGLVSSALCFYMVSVVGRMYYLDFGIISSFACLLLGCLGFRSRNCHWLPNRNYISGYIVLSAFSLLTCAGLLLLLFLQPKPGSPLADVTSGAVCGISGLSLLLTSTGVVASYCCKYPPPDNRVQHSARGFTV